MRLIKEHNMSMECLENMIPWERDIYLMLISNYIDENKIK
jgi:hypothetical protein